MGQFLRLRWRTEISLSILAGCTLAACGSQMQTQLLPQINETGNESGEVDVTPAPTANPSMARRPRTLSGASATLPLVAKAGPTFRLNQATNLRLKKENVFEFVFELPPNSEIRADKTSPIDNASFRRSDGRLARDSSGFIGPVQIVSIPAPEKISQTTIDEFNATPGGLFISASVVTGVFDLGGTFEPLSRLPAKADYARYFSDRGQPKFKFSKSLASKFGAYLNTKSAATPTELTKFNAVFAELQSDADRELPVEKSLLITDPGEAQKASKAYEVSGVTPPRGAWSIAVTATAKRHGFIKTPCAEFVSEELREAYRRAGFNATEDFNVARGNELIWSKTAAVAGLSAALLKAGWSPWDTALFAPPIGAIVLNGTGRSPGHAYLAAGANGRYIVDNGSPQGRDLGETRASTLAMMYEGGVFFLPPGKSPTPW